MPSVDSLGDVKCRAFDVGEDLVGCRCRGGWQEVASIADKEQAGLPVTALLCNKSAGLILTCPVTLNLHRDPAQTRHIASMSFRASGASWR